MNHYISSPHASDKGSRLNSLIVLCVSAIIVITTGCSPDPSESAAVDRGNPQDFMSDDTPWIMVFDLPAKEGDGVESWVTDANNVEGAEFSVVSDGYGPSSFALEASIGELSSKNPWDMQTFRPSIAVHPDQVYSLTAWIKGPRGSKIRIGIEEAGYLAVAYKEFVLLGDWQNVAFAFIPSEPTIRSTLQFAFPQNSNSSIFVDHVAIKSRAKL